MSIMSTRDGIYHNAKGKHLKSTDPEMRRAIALHLIAHKIVDGEDPEPIRNDWPTGTDPWIADTGDRVSSILGAKVRLLMAERGILQRDIAELMGITIGALSDRLAGRVEFSLAQGLWLESALDEPMDTLLGR